MSQLSAPANQRAASPGSFPTRVLYLVGAVALLLALASGGVTLWLQSRALVGTSLDKAAAPDFQLIDQNGSPVALSQYRGKPVVLTFLYTSCPDACPLIADKLRQTTDLLGKDASGIGILAVTTDPKHDDRVAATKFTQEHQMGGRWHFLLGSPEQLAPIWQAYYVGVSEGDASSSGQADGAGGSIIHSDPLFVIDKAGRERVLLADDFKPKDLAKDLKTLLRE